VFTQFGNFAATAAQGQADAAAGRISADQANRALFDAQQSAEAGMKVAALELATDITTQILAKGGTYVAVMTLSDIADTPFGNSAQVQPARSVLTALSQTFNLWLREGLTNQPVQIIDTFALFKDAYLNPGKYGILNNTIPACDPVKISAVIGQTITSGYSLFCNATPGAPYNGLRAGSDVTVWQFADDVHPTTGGHKIISDAFSAQLKSFGWI
jgi:phospholipase/lecithinase/hemolysin